MSARTVQRLITASENTGLPLVTANDNRHSAGTVDSDGVLSVELEVVWAEFRIETADRPGLRLTAIKETGKAPSIPAPLFRVTEGTRVRVSIRNSLTDSSLTIFGLHKRPAETVDSLYVLPGEVVLHEFEAGVAGTYMYWARLGAGVQSSSGEEREQLAGAFIIDVTDPVEDDRIFVMNIFSAAVDSTMSANGYVEALTISGKSWPFTERQELEVGETQRWRIINASTRNHPMHLHGFFYDITVLGDPLVNERYSDSDRKNVVTHFMRGRTTMDIEWTPSRPVNWLFHCHLSFHVTNEIRLPGAAALDPPGEHPHMAGLVIGIEVQPGPTELIHSGDDRYITLYANEYEAPGRTRYSFSFDPTSRPDSLNRGTPGPSLFLRQNQATYVTVENRLSVPTGIHWHGLELDGWADGVPNWSASDGKVSPAIEPGASFTYKLSSMRSGTFIYHSHLDDIQQLTGGLYRAIIVLPEEEKFDPVHDHLAIVGWRETNPQRLADLELNGLEDQPDVMVQVGESHRIRLINIAPAGAIFIQMKKGEEGIPLLAIAKDSADFPDNQRKEVAISKRFGVGETADFVFSPTARGEYELTIGLGGKFVWTQKWVVN